MDMITAKARQKIFGTRSESDQQTNDLSSPISPTGSSPNRSPVTEPSQSPPLAELLRSQSNRPPFLTGSSPPHRQPSTHLPDAAATEARKERLGKASSYPGTFKYIVQESETLRSIAAKFDTTPSVLSRINKLSINFSYPGQVLLIPDSDYVDITAIASEKEGAQQRNSHSDNDSKPAKVEEKPSLPFPGHIMRMNRSCHSIVDESELPPRPLSADEAQYLDQECFERFIKMNSNYITESHGVVDGTLLVTPNAVMFDPNLSHKLVVEMGADEFGMIAPMDTVMSVAIYHDINAMERLNEHKRDSSVSRPEVFRSSNSLVSDGQSEASQSATLDPPKQPAHNNSDNHTAAANISNDNVMIGSSPFILDPSILMAPNLPRYDKESPQDVPGPTPTGHMVDIVPSDVTMSDAIPSDVTQSDDTPSGDMPSGDTQSDVTLSRVTLPPTDDDEKQRDEKESGEVETTVEYSLHEYDMVNGTHSVGNSLFYTIANPANSDVFTVGQPTSARIIQNKTSALPTGTAVPPVQLEGAVKLSDKPDLFQSLDEMIPEGLVSDRKHDHTKEQSLFLCLNVGRPVNKQVSKTCPIESYNKKKRPEYWFSVSRDKVDQLYAFFIQWKPEAYNTDDQQWADLGFRAITGNSAEAEELTSAACDSGHCIPSQLSNTVTKDWEIISVEEVRRRRSLLDIEMSMPLPDLIGDSVILEEQHLRQLMKAMPGRIEGYPWTLVFSTENNGFSLSTMYRCLQSIDSPVLLAIMSTEKHLFGALSSCAFRVSDSFYGTGESFLFTFVDGFKTYPWSGVKSLFNKGDHNCLSIGAGEGSYGIWLDGDLNHGRTQNCLTYANDPLTGALEDFQIDHIEIWSFHDDF